jgi:hypothetical protein
MCASWNDKFKPDLIANRLEQLKTIDRNTGKASFSSFDHFDLTAVFCSIARLSETIPETEKHRIISHSILSAESKGKITAKSLLKEIAILEQIYLNKKLEQYVLATSLSLDKTTNIPNYKLESTVITITPKLPLAFIKNREKPQRQVNYIIDKIPTNYLATRVLVSAKSTNEAAEKAFQSLDLIRGIWNLSLNKMTWLSISFGGKPKPINNILLGPFHTLHERNGNLRTDNFWYQPNFESMEPYGFSKKEEYDYFISFTKFIRNKLKRCPYQKFISEGIIRYTRALDYSDYEVAFVKLWSILEMLTYTLKETYEKTIKRTAFIFKDYDFHYQVLNHLREFRNKSIHSPGSGSDESKTYLYQLKRYVERLLIFHLTTKNRFPGLSSMGEFLDLPPDPELLKTKCKLLQKGIRFLS